jgi:hypothetical protein
MSDKSLAKTKKVPILGKLWMRVGLASALALTTYSILIAAFWWLVGSITGEE